MESASDDVQNAFVTPFDVKWDYLINWNHDFVGKEALQKIAENPKRTIFLNTDDLIRFIEDLDYTVNVIDLS